MIRYYNGLFGLWMMFRLHGSAAFRALIPSSISVAILLGIFYGGDVLLMPRNDDWLSHPYAIGAMMVAFTFLLTFKNTFSYNRYWEACTVVHQMHSKWLDVGVALSAFHLQSNKFDRVRPAALGEHPHITTALRERERVDETTLESLQKLLDEDDPVDSLRTRFQKRYSKADIQGHPSLSSKLQPVSASADPAVHARLDGGMDKDHPSLFLQELLHLLSLTSAVALSTLRNDVEGVESPLVQYKPGEPWPPVDPDAQDAQIRNDFYNAEHQCCSGVRQTLRFLFGSSRDEKHRTLYNAARPFRVLGGVSDAEVQLLQSARGPYAKVALCSMWLQEFITREHLAGSTGKVAPPIVSRMFQFTSDGMIGYNHARKIAFIPFPFPHAQITAFFILVSMVYIPFLMLSYVNNIAFAAILNFFTVLCFAGLYEVSRELENPFVNVPNDLPLNNFQAQFNEALLVLYAGYHPDAWWQTEQEFHHSKHSTTSKTAKEIPSPETAPTDAAATAVALSTVTEESIHENPTSPTKDAFQDEENAKRSSLVWAGDEEEARNKWVEEKNAKQEEALEEGRTESS